MKYILVHSYNHKIQKLGAQNYEDAVKESLAWAISDRWLISIPAVIDYANFSEWLINWLKETRYWDIEAIEKNVKNTLENYGSFKETVIGNLNLLSWGKMKIYEINSEHQVEDKVHDFGLKVVGDAIFEILAKRKEDEELAIYKRLKEKFEKNTEGIKA